MWNLNLLSILVYVGFANPGKLRKKVLHYLLQNIDSHKENRAGAIETLWVMLKVSNGGKREPNNRKLTLNRVF